MPRYTNSGIKKVVICIYILCFCVSGYTATITDVYNAIDNVEYLLGSQGNLGYLLQIDNAVVGLKNQIERIFTGSNSNVGENVIELLWFCANALTNTVAYCNNVRSCLEVDALGSDAWSALGNPSVLRNDAQYVNTLLGAILDQGNLASISDSISLNIYSECVDFVNSSYQIMSNQISIVDNQILQNGFLSSISNSVSNIDSFLSEWYYSWIEAKDYIERSSLWLEALYYDFADFLGKFSNYSQIVTNSLGKASEYSIRVVQFLDSESILNYKSSYVKSSLTLHDLPGSLSNYKSVLQQIYSALFILVKNSITDSYISQRSLNVDWYQLSYLDAISNLISNVSSTNYQSILEYIATNTQYLVQDSTGIIQDVVDGSYDNLTNHYFSTRTNILSRMENLLAIIAFGNQGQSSNILDSATQERADTFRDNISDYLDAGSDSLQDSFGFFENYNNGLISRFSSYFSMFPQFSLQNFDVLVLPTDDKISFSVGDLGSFPDILRNTCILCYCALFAWFYWLIFRFGIILVGKLYRVILGFIDSFGGH